MLRAPPWNRATLSAVSSRVSSGSAEIQSPTTSNLRQLQDSSSFTVLHLAAPAFDLPIQKLHARPISACVEYHLHILPRGKVQQRT